MEFGIEVQVGSRFMRYLAQGNIQEIALNSAKVPGTVLPGTVLPIAYKVFKLAENKFFEKGV